jgi:hypothetical protein
MGGSAVISVSKCQKAHKTTVAWNWNARNRSIAVISSGSVPNAGTGWEADIKVFGIEGC